MKLLSQFNDNGK